MEFKNEYLQSVKKQFLLYKKLGEKAMEQLKEEQLFYSPNEDSNSIAIIVHHLYGNMLSRWTDFLTTDGEKPWRQRDGEFEDTVKGKDAVLKMWEDGWDCFFKAINSLTAEQLSQTIYIRQEPHSVMEAINRQLAHYSYHVGQIVFAAKQLKEGEWSSLSIPRRKS
jgi:hypothetical protein